MKSKAKKAVVSKIVTEHRPSPVVKKLQPPLPLTRAEAEEIVSSFQQEHFYIGFQSDLLQSHDVVEIPSAVLSVMEQLRSNFEVKFGEKNSSSKLKFMRRIKKPCLCWKQRADILYFLMHPGFANGDTQLTSDVFDIPKTTIRSWLNEQRFYPKSLPFLKELQPYKVQQIIPSSTGQIWKDGKLEM